MNMRIVISTQVKQPFQTVFAGFEKELFLKLNPPFPKVKLKRFDGSQTGDIVTIELNFLLFKQTWVSKIIDHQSNQDEIYFIDQGIKLPFFLKSWQHQHRILNEGHQARIVDDIDYKTPFWLMDYLMYPLMYVQFLYRKPIYRRYFA